MLNFLRALIGKATDPGPLPRLNREHVHAIARKAAADTAFADQPFATALKHDGTRLLHLVTTTTIGQQFEVVIDDETGEVLSAQTVGVR